jgi:hypothetical protein
MTGPTETGRAGRAPVRVDPERLSISLPRPAVAGLIAFGAAGLLLALILLVGLVRLASTANGLANQGRSLVALMDSGQATAVNGRGAAERAQAGVAATADAADQAAGFVSELASALRETAASLRIELLGSRPFAAAADRVDHAADQADETVSGLRTAASDARAGAIQLGSVTADLDRIAANMSGIADGLRKGTTAGLDDGSLTVLELALAGLVIWLAVPAALCLGLGIVLWRRPARARLPASRREPVR